MRIGTAMAVGLCAMPLAACDEDHTPMIDTFKAACIDTAPDFTGAIAAAGDTYEESGGRGGGVHVRVGSPGGPLLTLKHEEDENSQTQSVSTCRLFIFDVGADSDWVDSFISKANSVFSDSFGRSAEYIITHRKRNPKIEGRASRIYGEQPYDIKFGAYVMPKRSFANSFGADLWIVASKCSNTECPEAK